VHVYGDAPIHVLASDRFVCIHVAAAGRYRLRLPGDNRWRDLFTGQAVSNNEFIFPEKSVALFYRSAENEK
jgi:hypothetical protein